MQKGKILLIVPRYNIRYFTKDINKPNYAYTFPMGSAYISAILKREGYEVTCLNLNHFGGSLKAIIDKNLDKKYAYVCLGASALEYHTTKAIVEIVKNHKSKPKVILGGLLITCEPEVVFEDLGVDYGIIGEGEEIIVDLLSHLDKNKDVSNVKGIIYRDNKNKIVFTGRKELNNDLDNLPFPDVESLGFKEYLDNTPCNSRYSSAVFDYPRIYTVVASRGCPFNCTFCSHYNKYRKRSLDNVMRELYDVVKKYRINLITYQDEIVAFSKEKLYKLCEKMNKLRKETSWELKWALQLTVRNIDMGILKKLKESGVNIISYGFESYSKEVLKSMKKPITPEQINRAFHKTLEAGLGVQANFIFGDVAETKETAKETLDWWKKNAQGQVRLGFIQPYPGSEIYEHCLKKGIIKDKLDFLNKSGTQIGVWYNMTNNMNDKEIGRLKKEILNSEGRYCKFVIPISMKKEKENIYQFKVQCPFCGNINDYKNCFIKSKWAYGFSITCRKCNLRFFIVSYLQKIAYKYYSRIRTLQDYRVKIYETFKKTKIKKINFF